MAVDKLPSGKWRARVKFRGRVVATRSFSLKRDADAWEASQKRALVTGEFVDPKLGKEPLESVAALWLSTRDGTRSSATVATDRSIVNGIPSWLGRRPIATVRTPDIEDFFDELVRDGKRESTVRRHKATLSNVFTWALKRRIVAKNPVTGTKIPTGTGLHPKRQIRPFSQTQLSEVLLELSPEHSRLIHFLCLTGLRWGEMRALRVSDVIDVPKWSIYVEHSASDNHPERVTKNGESRVVPLADTLIPVVQASMAGKGPDDYLFTTRRGARYNGSNFVRDSGWKTAAKGRNIHQTRHTAATLWLTWGVNPKTVQAYLGHKSMMETVDTYSHYMGQEADRDALAKINAALSVTPVSPEKPESSGIAT